MHNKSLALHILNSNKAADEQGWQNTSWTKIVEKIDLDKLKQLESELDAIKAGPSKLRKLITCKIGFKQYFSYTSLKEKQIEQMKEKLDIDNDANDQRMHEIYNRQKVAL